MKKLFKMLKDNCSGISPGQLDKIVKAEYEAKVPITGYF